MKKSKLIMVVVVFVFLFSDYELWAGTSVYSPAGWGGRATGMGGVGVATVNDCSAMIYNPAAITRIERKRVDIGMGILRPWKLYFRNQWNEQAKCSTRRYYAPQSGYVHNLENSPVSIGAGLFFTYGAGSEWDFNTPFFNETKQASSKAGIIKITPTIAYQWSEHLSVGFTLDINYGKVQLQGPLGPVYLDLATADGWGFGFAVGVLYEPTDRLSLGLSYTSETNLDDLKSSRATIELSPLPPWGGSVWQYNDARVIDFQQPCTLAAGIGYRFTDYFLVGLDCSWRNYADTLENLKIELSGGTGPDQTMIIPTRANNVFSVILGAELKLTRNLTFRAGYCHDTKVSPDDRILYMAYMAGKGRTAAVGLGWQWDFYSVDIAWSRHFRDIAEAGTSKFAAPEFDNSTFEYGFDTWVMTISKVF